MRSLVVQDAIPPNLAATSNSPVEAGNLISLTIGEILPATTYSWIGPNTFTSSQRSATIPSATEAMEGTYTVTLNIAGGCSFTATTQVSLANCDIYIQDYDAAGAETFELNRTNANATAQTTTYEPITLKILPFTGTSTFDAYNITWMLNGNPIPLAPKLITYTVNTPGNYSALLTLKTNVATTCVAEAHVNGKPCKTFAELACGTLPNINLPDIQAAGISLAEGDKFTACDFTVVITEITSGDPAGYIGTGYVEMKLVAGIIAKKVAIDFTNLVVNTCYEMAAGDVVTQYDPNWGGVLDLDPSGNPNIPDSDQNQADEISKKNLEISDILEVFDCSNDQKTNLNKLIAELDILASQAQSNDEYSETQKLSLKNGVVEVKSLIDGLLSCCVSSSGGRVSADNCVSPKSIQEKIAENNAISLEISKNPANLACGKTDRGFSNYPDLVNPTWRIIFDKGTWTHNLIQMYYKNLTIAVKDKVYIEYKIPRSNATLDKYGFADIVNEFTQEIFEIKSADGVSQGRTEVERYIKQANFYCPPNGAGIYIKGTVFPSTEFFWPYDPSKKLKVIKAEDGVITYEYIANTNPVLEPTPVTFPVPENVFIRIKEFLRKSFSEPDPAKIGGYALQLYKTMSRIEVRTVMSGAVGVAAAYYYTTRGKNTLVTARVSLVAGVLISVGWDYLYK